MFFMNDMPIESWRWEQSWENEDNYAPYEKQTETKKVVVN